MDSSGKLRLAADENLHRGIDPHIDLVSIQQSPLEGADDPTVLEWAAASDRVLLSHDLATIPKYARDRLAAGRKMPGVIAIRQDLPLGRVLEDLILMIECSLKGEFEGRIEFLPLRRVSEVKKLNRRCRLDSCLRDSPLLPRIVCGFVARK